MEKVSKRIFKIGDGIVFHYTSLDTFFKILDGIKYNHFIFHASDIFTMNDPSEFIYGFEKLWKLLPDIEDELYDFIKKNGTNNINLKFLDDSYRISKMWNNLKGQEKNWIKAYIEGLHQSYKTPFVVSFSCHDDFLPMWSTYGDNGHGIAIGIDIQSYYNVNVDSSGMKYFDMTKMFSDDFTALLVAYDKITKIHPLAQYVRHYIYRYLQALSDFNGPLLSLQLLFLDKISEITSAMIKNKAYKYEKESRLVVEKYSSKDVLFRINQEKRVLPYIKVGIPITKIKKIMIGPCCEYHNVKNAIKTRLSQLGFFLEDKDFVRSKVPYRP